MPKITRPVMFDAPEADRILEALQVFPPDNPWNEDISGLPVQANSDKKYGMFVADNGGDWLMSIAPDKRLQGLETLGRVRGKDFEVVQTTGRDEGPRRR